MREFNSQNPQGISNGLAKFIILSKADLPEFMDYCNLYWDHRIFL
jgi:hypothetical protein